MKRLVELGSRTVAVVMLGALVTACGGDDSSPDTDGSGGTSSGGTSSGGTQGSGGSGASSSGGTQGSGGSGASSSGGTQGSGGSATSSSTGGTTGQAGAGGEAGAMATSSGGAAGDTGDDPVCGGTATECSSYDTAESCSTQLGCNVGVCDGEASCATHGDRGSCEADGCEWLTPCEPVVACDTFMASVACNGQQGCEWDAGGETCNVKLTEGCADATSEDSCADLIGCVWADENFACSGAATACEELDEATCSLQAGCEEP